MIAVACLELPLMPMEETPFETEVIMYCILPVNVYSQLQTDLDRIGPQVNLMKQL